MEENTVVTTPTESAPEAGFQPATVFAFAPETEAPPVDEAKDEQEVSETVAAEEPAQEVDAPAEPTTQKDINAAFGNEKRRIREAERAKYEEQISKDPFRRLGKMMVDDIIQSQGVSEEDAIQTVTDNFLKAIAKREGITPTVARKLYGTEIKQEVEKAAEAEPESDVERIVREVQEAPKPEGFDESTAFNDPKFIQMLTEMPAAAAIRVYHAEKKAANVEQDIAEKLMSRQRVPQMTKPQQPASPVVDWRKVDAATFREEKERRRRMR